jgi:hypothetical protein
MVRDPFMLRPHLTVLLVSLRLVCAPPAFAHTKIFASSELARETHYPMDITKPGMPGPWGQISLTTRMLQPSPDSFSASRLTSEQPRWVFNGHSATGVHSALLAAGLANDQVELLMATRTQAPDATAVTLIPSDTVLLGLAPEIRQRIYALLDDGEGSDLYHYPIHFPSAFAAAWYRHAPLQPSTIALLDQLVYPRGDMLYFSDLRYLYSKINSAVERRHLAAALLRQPAVNMRVSISNAAEAEVATAYWGQGKRDAVLRPLLDALWRENANRSMEIIQLLPPLARNRLNTFQDDSGTKFLDCRWTALNFLSDTPDDRFLRDDEIVRALKEDYVSIPDRFVLGDLILLRNKSGEIIHMCNYVADNIVFTKNGGDRAQPWMLSALRDVIKYYTISGDIPAFMVLRHK